jgi:four helix bundle protein
MISSIKIDKMAAKNFKETKVYKLAYEQAMEIFKTSKSFPSEEKYSLTDQIRRASRSVCTNIAEAYRKKKYPAHFVLKVTDSDPENSETGVWLDFSKDCFYLDEKQHKALIERNEEIGRLLNHMINNPDKY